MALEYLASRGITAETADIFGLSYEPGRHAIAIPYFTALGTVSTTRYRLLEGAQKYDSERGSKLHLYNVGDAGRSPVYVTEGEFDAIVLRQTGRYAVGVPGTQGWKPEWRWLFQDSVVHIAFDGDEPGHKGALAVARSLTRHAEVDIVEMPDGADVTDLYMQGTLEKVLDG